MIIGFQLGLIHINIQICPPGVQAEVSHFLSTITKSPGIGFSQGKLNFLQSHSQALELKLQALLRLIQFFFAIALTNHLHQGVLAGSNHNNSFNFLLSSILFSLRPKYCLASSNILLVCHSGKLAIVSVNNASNSISGHFSKSYSCQRLL